jgi:hypothetical protein
MYIIKYTCNFMDKKDNGGGGDQEDLSTEYSEGRESTLIKGNTPDINAIN